MTKASSIFARAATLAVMALCVAGLMRLFEGGASLKPAAASIAGHAAQETNAVAAMADSWRGEINYAPAYAALHPYADTAAQTPGSTFDPNDVYWGLPRQPGYETVAAYCSACHTLQIVMAQRQSREGWDYLLHWMVEKQSMAEPAPETREEMLNYLSRELGE